MTAQSSMAHGYFVPDTSYRQLVQGQRLKKFDLDDVRTCGLP